MTRTDIINEYKRINKSILTDEDAIKLGLMHRQLPRSERSWSWLVNLIGWRGSSESLRMLVLRYLKDTRNMNMQPSITVPENATVDERVKIANEIQKLKDERTELNRIRRDEARVERFKESIADAIKELPKLPKVKYEGKARSSTTEAILMISDLHIGVEIDEYCNKYNLEIAIKRMNKLVEDTIRYCKSNNVKKLSVVNLGDLISGIIHTTIRIQQEFDVITQVIQASEIMANVLCKLQEAVPELVYRSCTDNHSRIVADKHDAIEKESFTKIIDWYLMERLKDSKVIFANDNLSDDLGKFYLNNGKLVMFSHGHLDSPNKSFQHFIGATEEYVHYVLLGHFHAEKTKYFQNLRVFTNGSVVGTDAYAESKRLYTKPAQSLLIFDNDNIISHSINLDIV